MSRPLSLALLVAGIVLLILGLNSSDSIASQFSEVFTGAPTDKAIWLTLGGIVLTIVGAAGLLRRPK